MNKKIRTAIKNGGTHTCLPAGRSSLCRRFGRHPDRAKRASGLYKKEFSSSLGKLCAFLDCKKLILFIFFLFIFLQFILLTTNISAQNDGSVELNGDIIEYSVDGNIVTAQGNVIIVHKGSELHCDKIEFHRDTQMAYAEGNVRLKMKDGEILGRELEFNFATMTGDFHNARIRANPYYGEGRKISKVGDNEIVMRDGYMTTSDFDKPEYRIKSSKMTIYPGEKLVARNVRMLMGSVPVMYLPRYVQDLRDKKPRFILTPGYDKEWGAFLLTQWRYYFSENFKGVLRADFREKKDIATGLDVHYKTTSFGSGVIRLYYMNERSITSKRFYLERPTPTIERERFKVDWRHKWEIDDKTNAVWQYYRASDKDILKDYFEKEYENDSVPKTFFLLTRTVPTGVLSFRIDARPNRFVSGIERLPEIRYDHSNEEIGNTGLFFKNTTMFSNLSKKDASPTEVRKETKRFHVDSEISYPMKIKFIEFKPFVGTTQTYYSKTKSRSKYNSIRGAFRTGASLSTRFYKVFDLQSDFLGMDINKLRHIIIPTVSYNYAPDPTMPSSELDVFDSAIENINRRHTIDFAIENKLQTKRNGKTVDFLRSVVSTDFQLKENPSKGGFNLIKADIDFRPNDWISLFFDSVYDTREDALSTANFDLYINGKDDKWSFGVGKRFRRRLDDEVTVEWKWKINPKWKFRVLDRFNVEDGTQKELDLTITRDLHSWIMDINFSEEREHGSEILIIFTLKAFPEIGIDAGTSFNKRKAGSQSGEQ